MSVYVIAQLSIHDDERYGRYMKSFAATLRPFDGRLLVADPDPEVLEGEVAPDKVVVLEFASREEADRWADSDAYRAIAQDRRAAADALVLAVRAVGGDVNGAPAAASVGLERSHEGTMLGTNDLHAERVGDGVWLLRLRRPDRRNALSLDLQRALSQAVETLAARSDVSAIVLSGTGSVFCAGFDLEELARSQQEEALAVELWAVSDRLHHAVLRCAVPVVCALNGPALAGGFDLATLCDLRIADRGVWFARPEVDFGIPMFGPLRELVGGSLARELCLTARRVEAEEALRIGLVNRIVEPGGAEAAAIEIAFQIAARSPAAVRAVKAKIVESTGLAGRATLGL